MTAITMATQIETKNLDMIGQFVRIDQLQADIDWKQQEQTFAPRAIVISAVTAGRGLVLVTLAIAKLMLGFELA